MPGNPRECRQHALNCQRLAELARHADERQRLLSLADTWLGLAAELESMGALLNALGQLNSGEGNREEDEDHVSPP